MPPARYVCRECRHLILSRFYQCGSRASPLRFVSSSTRNTPAPAKCHAVASCQKQSHRFFSSKIDRLDNATPDDLVGEIDGRHKENENRLAEEDIRDSERSTSVREFGGGIEEAAEDLAPVEDADANGQYENEEVDAVEYITSEQAFENARANLDPEQVAQYARRRFRDRLPVGALTPVEYEAYERMYGTPLEWTEDVDEESHDNEQDLEDYEDSGIASGLFKETQDGRFEQIEMMDEEELLEHEEGDLEYEDELARSKADEQLQQDILASMNRDDEDHDMRAFLGEVTSDSSTETRAHPFTLASRSGTQPSTINISKDAMVGPVTAIVSDFANRHLDETAQSLFGGPGLPYATGAPLSARQLKQKPIPMLSSHSRMTATEANVYTIALWPGMYSSVFSVFVELRRRLGSPWLQHLFNKSEGPSILDAGSGGAGVVAWREVLKAEWARMHSDATQGNNFPMGKATVLTASTALRARASALLENTTFLPRLPDYIHITDFSDTAPRKQFDVIIAPHTLWPIEEDYLRRQHVDNLWSMLNPAGGILILLEKGVPRGFEAIADARQHLLRNLFTNSPSSRSPAEKYMANEYEPPNLTPGIPPTSPAIRRGQAAIIAPCTTHEQCPLYTVQGVSKQRKDYCRFEQRYIRPSYYQRMLGARDRNHEDVPFSYVAIQRGRSLDSLANYGRTVPTQSPLTGSEATDRAFEGYDIYDEDLESAHGGTRHEAAVTAVPSQIAEQTRPSAPDPTSPPSDSEPTTSDTDPLITPEPQTLAPSPFILPRLVLPPLKRHGHVMLDVCTPAGTLERWTVPRSYGKQAYRDARKAQWGDLWALGAKLRVARNVRLGSKGGETIVAPKTADLPRKKGRVTSGSGEGGHEDEVEEDGEGQVGRKRSEGGGDGVGAGAKTKREDKIKGREKRRFEKRMAKRENRSKIDRVRQ